MREKGYLRLWARPSTHKVLKIKAAEKGISMVDLLDNLIDNNTSENKKHERFNFKF